MIGVNACGIYIPKYRIKLSEISSAWGWPPYSGEIAVAPPDEDVFTLGLKAAKNAIKKARIESEEIGLICFCSTTSPYVERSFASSLAYALGASGARVADYGFSYRSATSAMLGAIDTVRSKIIKYALVVASDNLIGKPGTDREMIMGAGAGACIISSNDVVTEVEGSSSYSTGFPDRWRKVGELYTKFESDRYVRQFGYVNHVTKAVKDLMDGLGIESSDFNYVILQPMFGWDMRASRALGFKSEQKKEDFTQWFGETGTASILIGLTSIFDEIKPDERILAVSYDSGGSDAISLICRERAKARGDVASIKHFIENKEYLGYPKYLQFKNVFRE